ncbi:MAG: hypothetical protein EU530_09295 [Promethearchaeota archaeon]|nr:MAG: hypothetical protein EU530_09295 [Candidatus Lokiarchaeota archaeon]
MWDEKNNVHILKERPMKVNLFEVKEEHGYESNWWKHIRCLDFGFIENVRNMGSYIVEENDILWLNQRAPEGFFEKYWFIATDMGVERTNKSEISEVLTKSLVEFVRAHGKMPFGCSIFKEFKNKSIQINFEPNKFDKVVMKLSPGEFDIEDVQNFFRGLISVEQNPAESTFEEDKGEDKPKPKAKPRSTKPSIFPSGERITINKGEIKEIEKRKQSYEGREFYQYILHLINGIYELEGQPEIDFPEVFAQISESLYDKKNPQVGDIIFCKGRTKRDWTYGDLVHNIRTLNILK